MNNRDWKLAQEINRRRMDEMEPERRKAHAYEGCTYVGELHNARAKHTMLLVNVEVLKEFILATGHTVVYDRGVELGLFPAKSIWADGEIEF